jgi:hypothetical protein
MSESTDSERDEGDRFYGVGDSIKWDAGWEPVVLWVELPFWLMVGDCRVDVEVSQHLYEVEVKSSYAELHANEVQDSRATCVYAGPFPPKLRPDLAKELEEGGVPVLPRKCKTILLIHSRCNSDVLAAADETDHRRCRDLHFYLAALCAAHIPLVNKIIQSYRLATYDFFPHEVSPWDVPVWRVASPAGFVRCVLMPYAGWDYKPHCGPLHGESKEVAHVDPCGFQASMSLRPSPGELDLLDAQTLMERGDYSGAVRRITTAVEVMVEAALVEQISKRLSDAAVARFLKTTRMDFFRRIREYENLSQRQFPPKLRSELKRTREMRHGVVHAGDRIEYLGRGRAQRSVDTGRWVYNWFENNRDRSQLRERTLGARSVGRHFAVCVFDAELTSAGVIVRSTHGPGVRQHS